MSNEISHRFQWHHDYKLLDLFSKLSIKKFNHWHPFDGHKFEELACRENCFRIETWSCDVCNSLNDQNILTRIYMTTWLWTLEPLNKLSFSKLIHFQSCNGQNLVSICKCLLPSLAMYSLKIILLLKTYNYFDFSNHVQRNTP